MIKKLNNEKIAHNLLFLALTLVLPLVGYCLHNYKISYYSIVASAFIKLVISTDIRVLLLDFLMCFFCMRNEMTFTTFPFEMVPAFISIVLSCVIMPLKAIVLYGKRKIKYGMAFKSMLILGIVCFASAIWRNIFYNEAAFVGYEKSYHILLGYGLGAVFLVLPFFLLLISTNKTKDNTIIPNSMYLMGLVLLFQLFYVIVVEKHDLDSALSYSGIGWANKNCYMISLEITMPFFAYIFSKNMKRVDCLFFLIFSVLIGLGSDSRGAQITLGIALPFLAYLCIPRSKYRKRLMAPVVCAAYGLYVGLYFVVPFLKESIDRLIESIFQNDSFTSIVTGRDIFWEWIIEYVYTKDRHILFGGSFAYTFEINAAFYQDPNAFNLWLAHNTFMSLLAIGGTLGLIAGIFHYIDVIYNISKKPCSYRFCVVVLILIGFIHGMIDNVFFHILFMLPYLFIIQDYEPDEEVVIVK